MLINRNIWTNRPPSYCLSLLLLYEFYFYNFFKTFPWLFFSFHFGLITHFPRPTFFPTLMWGGFKCSWYYSKDSKFIGTKFTSAWTWRTRPPSVWVELLNWWNGSVNVSYTAMRHFNNLYFLMQVLLGAKN